MMLFPSLPLAPNVQITVKVPECHLFSGAWQNDKLWKETFAGGSTTVANLPSPISLCLLRFERTMGLDHPMVWFGNPCRVCVKAL